MVRCGPAIGALRLLLLLTLASAFAAGRAAAQADVLPPVLTAIAIDMAELTGGDTLRIRLTGTDANGIATVHAVYRTPAGETLWASTDNGDGGLIELAIPATLPNGPYRLAWVNLVDRVSPPNSVVYHRDGRVESEAPGAPTAHGLDFAVADFSVAGNDAADVMPPVLSALSVDHADLGETDDLRFRFTAADDSGIGTVHAVYSRPSGETLWVSTENGDAGLITYRIPGTLENGDYRLAWLSLADRVSPPNSVVYYRDGRVESASPGAPTAHPIDFAAADFAVSGNEAADTVPPTLDELLLLSPAALVAGDTLRIEFAATDDNPLGVTHFVYVMPDGRRLWVTHPAGRANPVTLPIAGTLPDGPYRLASVNMSDSVSPPNSAVYYRDGRVASASAQAPTAHALAFPSLDFTVTGNEFRAAEDEAPPDEDLPVEVEVTPVDEMGAPEGRGFANREIWISTTLGRLTAGAASGSRVRAQPVGGGRYVAQLRSGEAGRAVLRAEIDGRRLPPLALTFVETRAAVTVGLSGPAQARPGEAVVFRVQLAAAAGVPRGTVVLRRGATEIARAATTSLGFVRFALDGLPEGRHRITAQYLGAPGFRPAVSDALEVAVAPPPPPQALRGGGALFEATAACAPAWRAGPVPVTVRYWPGEGRDGGPSNLTLAWRGGSESVVLTAALVPADAPQAGTGRALWGAYRLHRPPPGLRVLARRITAPAGGAGIGAARAAVLRVVLSDFAGQAGCSVTLAATLGHPD